MSVIDDIFSLPVQEPVGPSLEAASVALGRLGGRLQASPVRVRWETHALMHGVAAAVNDEGLDLSGEALWRAITNQPQPLHRDYGGLRRGIELLEVANRLARGRRPRSYQIGFSDTARAEFVQIRVTERQLMRVGQGALSAASEWVKRGSSGAELSHQRFAMASLLRRRRVLNAFAPQLLPRVSAKLGKRGFLETVRANTQTSILALDRMEEDWRRASVVLARHAPGSRNESLVAVGQLLFCVENASPLWISKRVGVSLPTAGRLLSKLGDLGLAKEETGRGTYRSWSCHVSASAGEPPANAGFVDKLKAQNTTASVDLDSLFAELDQATRAANRQLSRGQDEPRL